MSEFDGVMSELRSIRKRLEKIGHTGGDLPSSGFVLLWLGVVPVLGAVLALIAFNALESGR